MEKVSRSISDITYPNDLINLEYILKAIHSDLATLEHYRKCFSEEELYEYRRDVIRANKLLHKFDRVRSEIRPEYLRSDTMIKLSSETLKIVREMFMLEEKYRHKAASIWREEVVRTSKGVLIDMLAHNDLDYVLDEKANEKVISTNFVSLRKNHTVFDGERRDIGIIHFVDEHNFLGASECDAMAFDENDKDVKDITRYPRDLGSLCVYDEDYKLYAGLLYSEYDEVTTKVKTPITLKRLGNLTYNNVVLLADKSIPVGVVCYLEPNERAKTSKSYQEAEAIAEHYGVSLRRVNRNLIS